MKNYNVLMCGVGGQGIILASKILSYGLIKGGYDVKMSEVHGMAQRGGSVTTQVRFGEKVFSPIIGLGKADVLVSYETMETERWLPYLSSNGKAIINTYAIPSAPILTGKVPYPTGVVEDIKAKVNTIAINAETLATSVGNIKTMNVIIVGALIKTLGLEMITNWEEAIEACVKPNLVAINLKALKIGMDAVTV
ncbi:indolepyruvate oxidoreductase subunit beta [Fusibacter paucivorans]|uniref:Indolepyruvate oxidoreductase subunit beta n=1 Tax=Fusibacter paucivorans TaxID=76009 RepID=A0ABS5PKE0_9FIRM|nr:indolepyruvate oxidoreductase subunit beta [Fusibacter paucivorans]MBS7525623.1 indolepyruvate oxidoreductase subunit beta [Fusibacter paucivorans]